MMESQSPNMLITLVLSTEQPVPNLQSRGLRKKPRSPLTSTFLDVRFSKALPAAKTLQGNADLEELFIDATIVRTHQHAAGAPKKTVTIKRSVAREAG